MLLSKVQRERCPYAEELLPFLTLAQDLFSLRMKAESRYKKNKWLAKQDSKALPLEWKTVDALLKHELRGPSAGLETLLARDLPPVLARIFEDIRRVLQRDRRLVSVGSVRQIDSGCLRWLLRQPGRSVSEKAGPRQRLLSVVRNEHYNTLENRVLKDFLLRVRTLTDLWLTKFNTAAFADSPEVTAVNHLNALCVKGLGLEYFDSVTPLKEMPTPNYVLQQDNRYAKVWKAYRLVMRWSHILEKLWNQREQLTAQLETFTLQAERLSQNKYLSELWIHPIGETNEIFESPILETTEVYTPSPTSQGETFCVIDLMGERLNDILLAPDKAHPNAKPRLIDFNRPYVDFTLDQCTLQRHRCLHIVDAWRTFDDTFLADYFIQLKQRLGGKQWVLLVPDNWSATWQERVLHAASQAFDYRRDKVSLLWRSMAAFIGTQASTSALMRCLRMDGEVDCARFKCFPEDPIPQRQSFRRHPENYTIPPYKTIADDHNLFTPAWTAHTAEVQDLFEVLDQGARKITTLIRQGRIPYYDDLEGLFLVVQTQSEEIKLYPLIPPNPKSPGGKSIHGEKNNAMRLMKGENSLKLWMQLSDTPDGSAGEALQSYALTFPQKYDETVPITLQAVLSPGQGLAQLKVTLPKVATRYLHLDTLETLRECDVNHTTTSTDPATISYIETCMERSFPPSASRVYADDELWAYLYIDDTTITPRAEVNYFMRYGRIRHSGTFARADAKYDENHPLPQDASPLERLCRKNVFGNIDHYRYPSSLTPEKARQIFERLAQHVEALTPDHPDWKSYVRLIAWTYQYDNPCFHPIRHLCLQRLVHATNDTARGSGISPQEFTLCANLFTTRDEWICCLDCICFALSRGKSFINFENYLRLFYNLMQFHPEFVEQTALYQNHNRLTHITHALCDAYKATASMYGTNKSKYQGYILKSLLYLLRCRRHDHHRFLSQTHDAALRQEVINILTQIKPSSTKVQLVETLLAYINGKGSIEGLPTD